MSFELTLETGKPEQYSGDVVVLFAEQDKDGELVETALPSLSEKQLSHFKGKSGEMEIFYEGGFDAERLLLVGVGKKDDFEYKNMTELGGKITKKLKKIEVESAGLLFPLELDQDKERVAIELALGLFLGDYEFKQYKKDDDEDDEDDQEEEVELDSITLLLEDARSRSTVQRGIDGGKSLKKGIVLSRNLANTPANDLTPMELSSYARKIGRNYKSVSTTVWEREKLEKQGMQLIMSVGKGSENPPCLIRLNYRPEKSKGHVVLAGKGVTFDTGGISIKPSKKMGEMKFDMCGAATVLGIIQAAAEMELPVQITGLVPAAENMVSESATRPGDIVTGYAGKSVEILNTDAEGRLILADTLAYISDKLGDELDILLDYATLTGACITALGHEAAAVMGNDDELCQEFEEVGADVFERVWHMPLYKEHSKQMESKIADVKNIGGRAGSLTAGAFLREFVDEDKIKSWAHFDIAGTGWGMEKLSYRPEGGTGFGVRLTIEFLRRHFSL